MNLYESEIKTLRQKRELYLQEIIRIDNALAALVDKAPRGNISFDNQPEQNGKGRKKKYNPERINNLLSQEFSDSFTYSEKLIYIVGNFGRMNIAQIADKVLEFVPEINYDIEKERLGYQAAILADNGILGRSKDTAVYEYWLPEQS